MRGKKKAIIIILAFLVVSVPLAVLALGVWYEGWRVNAGNTADITYNTNNTPLAPSTACVKVTNNSSRDYFVPTKTVAEKNAFCANAPSASCGACTSTPPPSSSPPPAEGCTNYDISYYEIWDHVCSDQSFCGNEEAGFPNCYPYIIGTEGTSTCSSGYTKVLDSLTIFAMWDYQQCVRQYPLEYCGDRCKLQRTATCVCN